MLRSETGSNPPSYRIGQKVRVRYPKDRPDEAWLDSFLENWGAAAAIGGFGACLVLFGAALLSK